MANFVKSLDIIYLAKTRGINLFIDQGRLAVKKGKNTALPPDLMGLIQAHKSELIAFLSQEVQLAEQSSYQEIRSIDACESYPVSNAQYRMWLVSQTEEGSLAHHIPNTIVLNNALDVAAFQRAVNSTIERHEILRTVFRTNDTGELRQYVLTLSELNFSIDLKDFRAQKNAQDSCKEYIAADVNKPFFLGQGPLLRAGLCRVSDSEYVFYYNMHHIISDAWSRDVLSRDVMKYYKAYATNTHPDLSPLRIQYKDYAVWESEQLNGGAFDTHRDYWLSRFRNGVVPVNLPTSKRRPKLKTFNGHEIGLQIGSNATAILRAFAVERGGTMFMALVSIWKVLLHRYTGETDITIGNPVSGRGHPDLEDQIGFYINILPLRTSIDPDQSFTALFEQIKEETVRSYEHQAYPFGKLLEDLNLIRDTSRSPIFDLDIDYRVAVGKSGQAVEAEEVQNRGVSVAKYDIEFDPIDSADGVYLLMRFNPDVYDYSMIERLIVHYKNLFHEVVAYPEKRIRDLDYLSNLEKQQLLHKFNHSSVIYPQNQTIIDLFIGQVQKAPDVKAVMFSGESLTYAALDELSNNLSHKLISEYRLTPGSFVGIHLDIGIDYIVAIIGILKAGCAYVPIDTEYPSDRKRYIAENADLKAIVTDTNYMYSSDFYTGAILAIDVELDVTEGLKSPINLAQAGSLSYILHTSGSTGVPKGVMVEHDSLMDYSAGLIKTLGLDRTYSYGLMSTPSADLGNTVLLGSLTTGGTLHLFSREMVMDIFALSEYFNTHPIDIIKIVPSHWQSLSSGDVVLLPRKTIVFGGESLTGDIINKIRKHGEGLTIFNHYGPTETTIGKLMHKVDFQMQYTIVPLGRPFSNTNVYVLDKHLNLVPTGVTGELYIGGAGLARGYLNRPETTMDAFLEHPFINGQRIYKTGDLARWSPDGEVEFVGRADDQVKIRGHRVEVKEIEWVLNQIEDLSQSIVIPRVSDDGTIKLVAYILSEKEALDKQAIFLFLKEKLPEYMIPKILVQIKEIPLTSNGKIDYKALPIGTDAEMDEETYVAPSTPCEEALALALQLVLKCAQVSIMDNFYQMGGDSLKAIQLYIQLKKKGFELSLASIINNPKLKDMAMEMKKSFHDESKNLNLKQIQLTWSERTEASENQKYFIQRPWAFIPSRVITLSNFFESVFSEKIVTFLRGYPSLLTVFERCEKGEDIMQCMVSCLDVKYDIKLVSEDNIQDPIQIEKLERMARSFLEKPFAYFDRTPLIRFFLVVDSSVANRAYLKISIAHALIDIDTCKHIADNFEQYWNGHAKEEDTYSNYSFAQWQKQFLNSSIGQLQRKWWSDYLRSFQFNTNAELQNGDLIRGIVQHVEIVGKQFELIKQTVKTLEVPLSALFLAIHQSMLDELIGSRYLQKIAVNGRELDYMEEDTKIVLGLTTNYLPMLIDPVGTYSFPEYVRNVYNRYMDMRLRQNIPYEVIRKDNLLETGNDINYGIKGYFNFRVSKGVILQKNVTYGAAVTSEENMWNSVNGLVLVCDLYENGMTLRLKYSKDSYFKLKQQMNFKSIINEKILLACQ